MNDREILERAAKVYGAAQIPEFGPWKSFFERDLDAGPDEFKEWDPLVYDGDALRLAVKLKLFVCIEFDQTYVCLHDDSHNPIVFVDHAGDSRAATRRAIVIAAAKFQMQGGWQS